MRTKRRVEGGRVGQGKREKVSRRERERERERERDGRGKRQRKRERSWTCLFIAGGVAAAVGLRRHRLSLLC